MRARSTCRKSVIAALALIIAAPAAAAEPTRVIHSPWLALRFEQDGAEAPLLHTESLVTEVQLRRAPFTIVLPVRGEADTYHLTAWTDRSIFASAEPEGRAGPDAPTDVPIYFGQGRGMADSDASSGVLMLDAEAQHYLQGLRLGPDAGRHVFHVSQLLGPDRKNARMRSQIEIEDVAGPLYLVVWFDVDSDGAMALGEYEFLILNFEQNRRAEPGQGADPQ